MRRYLVAAPMLFAGLLAAVLHLDLADEPDRSSEASAVSAAHAPEPSRAASRKSGATDLGPRAEVLSSRSVEAIEIGPAEPWIVRLVDRDRQPVRGAFVWTIGGFHGGTDAAGTVRIPGTADGEPPLVLCDLLDPLRRQLEARESTFVTRPAVPIHVTVLDGHTGERMPWVPVHATASIEPGPLPRMGDVAVFHDPKARPGRRTSTEFRVDAPEGFVRDDRTEFSSAVPLSRYTHRIDVPIVLRREVDVRVRVLGADGRAAKGAYVFATLDERNAGKSDRVDADGTATPREIPFYVGADLVVFADLEGRWVKSEPVRLRSVGRPVDIELVLPEEPPEWTFEARSGAGGGSGCGPGPRKIPDGPCRIDVVARRRNGRPAGYARVFLRGVREGTRHESLLVLDEQGRGAFAGVARGEWNLVLDETGINRVTRSVSLSASEARTVELVEDRGVTRTVVVTNELGDPLPFAVVRISGGGTRSDYAWLGDHGEQPTEFLADAQGRLRLDHLPDARIWFEGRYHARSGSVGIDPGVSDVELVLTLDH